MLPLSVSGGGGDPPSGGSGWGLGVALRYWLSPSSLPTLPVRSAGAGVAKGGRSWLRRLSASVGLPLLPPASDPASRAGVVLPACSARSPSSPTLVSSAAPFPSSSSSISSSRRVSFSRVAGRCVRATCLLTSSTWWRRALVLLLCVWAWFYPLGGWEARVLLACAFLVVEGVALVHAPAQAFLKSTPSHHPVHALLLFIVLAALVTALSFPFAAPPLPRTASALWPFHLRPLALNQLPLSAAQPPPPLDGSSVGLKQPSDAAGKLEPRPNGGAAAPGYEADQFSVIITSRDSARNLCLTILHVLLACDLRFVREVIVVDDGSVEPLADGLGRVLPSAAAALTRVIRLSAPAGSAAAKVVGAFHAEAHNLLFLEAHTRPAHGMLQPLLRTLKQYPKLVALPMLKDISHTTFGAFGGRSVGATMFSSWAFDVEWMDASALPKLSVPFESASSIAPVAPPASLPASSRRPPPPLSAVPLMPGAAFAISRGEFFRLGGLDLQMGGSGAESLEFSLRMWSCGSGLALVPEALVGNVFRQPTPALSSRRHPPDPLTTKYVNHKRTAAVWLDDFYASSFLPGHQLASAVATGPGLEDRAALRMRLHCRPFSAFVERFESLFERFGLLSQNLQQLQHLQSRLCLTVQPNPEHSRASDTSGPLGFLVLAVCNRLSHSGQLWQVAAQAQRLRWYAPDQNIRRSGRWCLTTQKQQQPRTGDEFGSDARAAVSLCDFDTAEEKGQGPSGSTPLGGAAAAQLWHFDFKDTGHIFHPSTNKSIATAGARPPTANGPTDEPMPGELDGRCLHVQAEDLRRFQALRKQGVAGETVPVYYAACRRTDVKDPQRKKIDWAAWKAKVLKIFSMQAARGYARALLGQKWKDTETQLLLLQREAELNSSVYDTHTQSEPIQRRHDAPHGAAGRLDQPHTRPQVEEGGEHPVAQQRLDPKLPSGIDRIKQADKLTQPLHQQPPNVPPTLPKNDALQQQAMKMQQQLPPVKQRQPPTPDMGTLDLGWRRRLSANGIVTDLPSAGSSGVVSVEELYVPQASNAEEAVWVASSHEFQGPEIESESSLLNDPVVVHIVRLFSDIGVPRSPAYTAVWTDPQAFRFIG
eukprot:GHVT01011834.1.p1 GENE.GHVT01011834.1~~GHVT01011834.1.p1  ORF type:complete len:1101 (+),score=279.69 GHVT01011834.1:1238-4540(+)